ncbi:hypothetical protein GJW-30_1_03870 [Variibacter gotjawalensis]|uniref:LTXXQ motif protein n=1 Tax=Variibacter gotjawalensis TaxID=1333996 RepID=A0A0S3PZE3_9BRAD|nr:Spy/CpxP family protein refolding chaperone [Variibacter gotjawalensis]NIK47151.1 hypothetical protein [Variibacter gotjawalensis]RZS49051.1 LTXXQ motif family protein [Variibacter gotjawalensis]BAT61313.1 hypothetical protein GJW-30_1_03870 [Variibacter gotjawalensis]
MPKLIVASFAALLLAASAPILVRAGSNGTTASIPAQPGVTPQRTSEIDDDDDLPTLEEYAQYGGPADPQTRADRALPDTKPEVSRQPTERREATEAQFDGPPRGPRPGQRMLQFCGPDGARVVERMNDRMERITRPTEAQRPALEKLKQASMRAHEAGKGACPTERYASVPMRFAEIEKRLTARLESIRIIRPALEEYYAVLNDEQKARLNLLSMQRPARAGHPDEEPQRRGDGQRGERDDWPRGWRGRL